MNGLKYDDFFTDRDAMNGFKYDDFRDLPNGPSRLSPKGNSVNSGLSHEGDTSEDSEIFSDLDLSYINHILNEEDIDEKLDMCQGHPALEATEKRFYEILGEKYPPSPDQTSLYINSSPETTDGSICMNSSQSSFGSTNSIRNASEGLEEPMGKIGVLHPFAESVHECQFMRGVEEARKFLPIEDKLVIDLEDHGIPLLRKPKQDNGLVEIKVEEEEREHVVYGSRGRKNRHNDDLELEEGRSSKQSAVDYSEETLRSEMFDLVLLCPESKGGEGALVLDNETIISAQNGNSRGSGTGMGRWKKQLKREVVDLRTLLIHCAQAVAIDDRRSANGLLKQIRQHASPFGDGTQRLALCFADGLEARLAGTGSDRYRSLVVKPVTATDILKAYKLYMVACPFKKVSHYFSNQMILNTIEKASKVHIIDFGIYFGFQWPSFIQRLAHRSGGPPKLRITGIEIPQPGFRPAERIEETGRRLAEYARIFNVPFEYHAIAAKWETIKIKDLRIDEDEVLVVNSFYRLKSLADETVAVDCPRNMVLNLIRKLNPAIFVQGVVNGSYNTPFFMTRFREAMFHFSALFDMLETNTAREDGQRMLIERTMFGREALNVIACEGSERVERPETYKQWQVRNLRAGFVQLPLNRDFMNKMAEKVKTEYHKDFITDEDSRWLLLGWKGRIIYALSAWKPNKR